MRLKRRAIVAAFSIGLTAARCGAQTTAPAANAADLYLQAAALLEAGLVWSPANLNLTYAGYPPFPSVWQAAEKAAWTANAKARDLAHEARGIDHADWGTPAPGTGPDAANLNGERILSNEMGDAALYQHLNGDDAAAMESVKDMLHLVKML